MTEYQFTYNDHNIIFTIDLLGREKVFSNEELVAKSTYSLSSVKKHEFTIEGEALTLSRHIASYDRAECQVRLSNAYSIIEKQTKLLIEFSYDGIETPFDEHDFD